MALQIGYNVLTVEGPRQPTVRRDQGLGFIPDYEKVTTPAVDYLAHNRSSQTDMDKLPLVGISIRGYLAVPKRGIRASHQALVLNDGVWNVRASFTKTFPESLLQLYASENQTALETIVDEAAANNASAASAIRWGVDQGLWAFETHSPYNWVQQGAAYQLENITGRITCPTWVGNAVDDTDFQGQPMQVYNALKKTNKDVTLVNFTGPAAYHCEAGAFITANLEVFAWLEKTLSKAEVD